MKSNTISNRAKSYDGVPFLSISDAVRVTGLAEGYFRRGLKDGTIPHVRSGVKYLVNIPALLHQLGADV